MKAVMISIQPKWCALIANGEKTIEVRKTRPKLETPFKCYIYCTVSGATKNCSENEKGRKNLLIDYCRDSILDDRQVITQDLKGRRQLGKHTTQAFNYGTVLNGKVIGEFICNKIEGLDYLTQISDLNLQNGRLELTGYTDVEPFYGGKVATIRSTLLSNKELVDYGQGKPLYAWHITDLKIYAEPKELSEFIGMCKYLEIDCLDCPYYDYKKGDCGKIITRPPQSWQYCVDISKIETTTRGE